ncbi:MAG TPA: hypothetical protein VIQ31_04610 [Phormidium sp.]
MFLSYIIDAIASVGGFQEKRLAQVDEITTLSLADCLSKSPDLATVHNQHQPKPIKNTSSLNFLGSNSNPINGRFHELSAANTRHSHEKETRYKNLHKYRPI